MRILVVGAGATGGYFGGRLAAAGRDVTFLVREARAAQLRANGLVIRSPAGGDLTLRDPQTLTRETLAASGAQPYDLVLLSCKAYDLDDAIESFAAAVGPETVILPLLNGMRHLDILQARFGTQAVLGGVCLIASTLNEKREIVHLNDAHAITFGELGGGISARVEAISAAFSNAGFNLKASERILQEMWEKWVFLASLAGSTCLFRAPVGVIVATPDGAATVERLFSECRAVAAEHGHAVRDSFLERSRSMLFATGSTLTASMLRDVQNGSRIEADHILGDLIRRGGAAQRASGELSVLRIVYSQLKAYEAQRA
ncbi:2-dehydropantoate 2-reductase [Paraburkholderia bannensis]|uniref:2-dehydropantoate 2-reductase n=1 Tax=Paraburkholderia bannensis TaxID=765414 RepID=A0A7W9TU74_9BURK|nr:MULTISPECIES: 2-dehydropantoate 2-reductase [Paraburkholderia]MBB3255227.1 2-dehydropantoate 2-reductase [Paraburkholderia sp. WP4_3_2]MBB6100761.1 2-dehydropantoate 2-reductase [Paraburkholderia bannensis]